MREIAFDLGFDYPQHFNQIFKKNTGMSPREFRS
ncbi:MAG: helix-turn-helix domain-containing protein [Marinifilum sp.]|nr:helix-turn-helix domain-containing protein [Marinifilum sp.]